MDVGLSEKEFRAEMYDIGFYVRNNASAPAVRNVHSETRMQPFSSSCLFRYYFFQFRGIGSRESASCSRVSCTIFFIALVYRRFLYFCLRERINVITRRKRIRRLGNLKYLLLYLCSFILVNDIRLVTFEFFK